MSGKLGTCAECKFFQPRKDDYGQCRRHAPNRRIDRWLRYHDSELLRDMAWSLRRLAPFSAVEADDQAMNAEATDNEIEEWPSVGDEDWCGEWQPR